MSRVDEAFEEGQFDDANEGSDQPILPIPLIDSRAGHSFIDDENILEWSSDENVAEELDEFDAEEDEMEAAAFDNLRAEDEDWEIVERDFTKQFNRIRQHVAVRTGAAQGIASTISDTAAVAALPAVNRPKPAKSKEASSIASSHAKDKAESQLQALSKYSSRLKNLDVPYELGVGVNRKGPSATANMKDKSDRATTEQVLDPRTRIILFKMIGRGLLHEVNGCVSTGKEANVYHATTPENKYVAIKIYKTSILVFKDRDKYVSGEYRFRRGYSRHNPRKMVRVWAEKEMRNLKRLQTVGIPSPEPMEVRENVLVMGFVGDKDGWASPRLKDADIPASEIPRLYAELLLMTRKMFQECKLVHADLSEYNILYHVEQPSVPFSNQSEAQIDQEPDTAHSQPAPEPLGHLYIIDVSQSVEHDHPHAFDFLRSDLRNIEDFFSKRGARCLGLRRSFEFVTRESFDSSESVEAELHRLLEEAENDPEGPEEEKMNEDSVFMKSYIPRTLNEVYDPERDVGVLNRGEGENLIYKDTIGIVAPPEKPSVRFADENDENEALEDSEGNEDEDEDGEEGDTASGEEQDGFQERKPRGHRHEDKEAKKERKKAAKTEAREKRKNKMPKAEKKRKVKTTSRSK